MISSSVSLLLDWAEPSLVVAFVVADCFERRTVVSSQTSVAVVLVLEKLSDMTKLSGI